MQSIYEITLFYLLSKSLMIKMFSNEESSFTQTQILFLFRVYCVFFGKLWGSQVQYLFRFGIWKIFEFTNNIYTHLCIIL